MPVGAFVTIKVHPGKNAEFEEAFALQVQGCKENETGQLLYQLVKSQTDADTYYVMELYKDTPALDFHRTAPHMEKTRPRVRATIADIKAIFVDAVKGF
jgi:quinol monooxygenase YgiN